PDIAIAPHGYLVVFASGKDRRIPTQPLHTNFKLDADAGYLGLIRPDGATAATEFAPAYPTQHPDVSYGVTQPAAGTSQTGYLRVATPGAPNGDALMLLETVKFSGAPGLFTGTFALELSGAGSGQRIRYVLAPSSASGASVAEPTAQSP